MSVDDRSGPRSMSWDMQPCGGWPEVTEEVRGSVEELGRKKTQKAKGRVSEEVGVVMRTEWH